jgi:hypothetical protein
VRREGEEGNERIRVEGGEVRRPLESVSSTIKRE